MDNLHHFLVVVGAGKRYLSLCLSVQERAYNLPEKIDSEGRVNDESLSRATSEVC